MLKKLLCVSLSFVLFLSALSFCVNAEAPKDGDVYTVPDIENSQIAVMPSYTQTYGTSEYDYVGMKQYWGVVRYYNYYCYKHRAQWYMMTGLNLTDAIYHAYNSGEKGLSYTKSCTYSSQTASSFSTSAGADAGGGDMIKASLNLGYGISRTVGKEYQISSRIEARIPRDAKTGYYKMQVCYNFYKMKILQKRASDNTLIDVQYVAMPYGTSYAAVLYSKDMNSWKLW